VGLWFWQGAGRSREYSGFYFGLTGDSITSDAGMHMFGPKQLAAYRDALVHPKKGPAERKVYDKVVKLKGVEIGGSHYKKVPREFDADHTNADLPRHNALYFCFTTEVPKEMHATTTDYCIKVYKQVWPLQQWLVGRLADALGDGGADLAQEPAIDDDLITWIKRDKPGAGAGHDDFAGGEAAALFAQPIGEPS